MNCKPNLRIWLLVAISLFFTNPDYAAGNPTHPLLVLANTDHFGSYTTEILKTEGFNEFQIDSLSGNKTSLKYLKEFRVIILAQIAISPAQKEMFEKYVEEGGNLIAFKPDKKLSDIFGIIDGDGTVQEAYLSINPNTEVGKGITAQSLQMHVLADKYTLKGGRAIATLFANSFTPTGFPAVVTNDYGKGHAISFLYNLPQNIVYTRQGNEQYAGLETDGITGIRAMDMFTNGWVDTAKNILNQADEQMRLLTHCIENLTTHTIPLPRFWYFPNALNCLVTLNNDGEDSKEAEFEPQFVDVNAAGGKMTLYIKEADLVSKTWVNFWVNKGFEISGHPDDTKQAVNPDWNTMDSVIRTLNIKLNNKFGIQSLITVTNHWFVWCGKNADGTKDFAAQARIEENNGIRLDCNYSHYDNYSNQGHFLGATGTNQGNYTGSGLVMKFADEQGRKINLYQQLNNVYDQQYMENKDPTGYFDCFRGLMDRSLEKEVYSFISVKAHNAEYFFSKTPLMHMLAYANSKHIPVWTELKLFYFLKAKEEASFTDIKFSKDKLIFKIKSSVTHSDNLTAMLPYWYIGKKINKITRNGIKQSYTVQSIKGFDYALFEIKPGFSYNLEVHYSNQ